MNLYWKKIKINVQGLYVLEVVPAWCYFPPATVHVFEKL